MKDPVEPKINFVKKANEGPRRDESKFCKKIVVNEPADPKLIFWENASEGPRKAKSKRSLKC